MAYNDRILSVQHRFKLLVQATRHKQGKRTAAVQLGKRLREAIMIIGSALAVYLMMVLLSYDGNDPGWMDTGGAGPVENIGGRVGALTADSLFNGIGYIAYVLPLLVMWGSWLVAYGNQRGERVLLWVLGVRWLGFLLTLLSACALAALHFVGPHMPISAGGAVGAIVGIGSVSLLGLLGATLLLLALWIIGASLLTGLSWLTVMDMLGAFSLKAWQRLQQWRHPEIEPEADDPAKQPAFEASRAPEPARPEAEPSVTAVPADPESATTEPEPTLATQRDSADDAGIPSLMPTEVADLAADEPRFAASPSQTASSVQIEPEADRLEPPIAEAAAPVEPSPATPGPEWHQNGPDFPIPPVATPPSADAAVPAADSPDEAQTTVADSSDASDATLPMDQPGEYRPEAPALVAGDESPDQQRPAAEPASNSLVSADDTPWPSATEDETLADPGDDRPAPADSAPPVEPPETAPHVEAEDEQPTTWPPPLTLLDQASPHAMGVSAEELTRMARLVEAKLADFGVSVTVAEADIQPGPVITRFELQPAPGLKSAKISNLHKDLARALSVTSVRVVEVIPGKSTIGLEIPNTTRETVLLSELLSSPAYLHSKSPLTIALGKDIGGKPRVADLSKMPHLLVAGTTGSGKSVAINAMLLTLLYKSKPAQVRLILIDPKMLELSIYEGIPHLLAPVVTDMKEAANALRWSVAEMERRYKLMSILGVRNIAGYNNKVEAAITRGEPIVDPLYDPSNAFDTEQAPPTLEPLPYIVIVIDEFADMMITVGKKVEELIARLAQKARAAGIHLILATQRPSVDVITGLIKANIPARMAFRVSSRVDSRTILDQMGAETLLGYGDMLYIPPGSSIPDRLHGAFVGDHEVHQVADYLKRMGPPDYIEDILEDPNEGLDVIPGLEPTDAAEGENDPLYDEAVAIVTRDRKASISYVQRRLKIGYNRAARLVEEMEAAGVVSAAQNGSSRDVLAPEPP